jgi:hypothetical protein
LQKSSDGTAGNMRTQTVVKRIRPEMAVADEIEVLLTSVGARIV